MTLEELYKIIEDRKKKLTKGSYVASFFKEGKDRILQKVGEESAEVIIAAKNQNKKETIAEIADLIFHTMILMAAYKISLTEILDELEKRRISGSKKQD